MRTKQEILELISYLENEKKKAIEINMTYLALSIAGQIELLKWVNGLT